MLNEDVVKNINKLNNEQDNINLELSKKANKEDLEKLIQGGPNVSVSKDISINNWILEENVYTAIVEHNLVTRKVIVSLIDKSTNNNVFCSYQILDDNSIKVFNELNNELECIVVNGNSSINMISATIDDNRSTETTTYSSVKIEALLKVLENKIDDIENLKEIDNIKCSTDTGEYIIENSKKGYLTNFNIEGKTLIDLWGKTSSDFSLWKATFVDGKINILTENDIRYSNFFTINYTSYKPDTIYTIIVDVDKNTLPSTSGIYIHSLGEENSVFIPNLTNIAIPGGVIGKFKYTFTTISDLSDCNAVLRSVLDNDTLTSGYEVSLKITILEGDYTDINIDYSNELLSVGQRDKIEFLSYQYSGINIFNKNADFKDNYILQYLNGEELISEASNHKYTLDYIEIEPDTEYTFYNCSRNICWYDINKSFIPAPLNERIIGDKDIFYVARSPKNAKYLRVTIIKDLHDNGNKTIITKGNKYDKKTIPHTLRGLANGIRDEIVYKNGSYKLIKRCEEIVFNGNENWIEVHGMYEFRLNLDISVLRLDMSKFITNLYKQSHVDYIFNVQTESALSISTENGIGVIDIVDTSISPFSIANFKEKLKKNPLKIIYELEIPREVELGLLNLEQYDNQTGFICSSGITIPNVSFESTRNLGSHIEVIRENLKDITTLTESNVDFKFINGWDKVWQSATITKVGKYLFVNMIVTKSTSSTVLEEAIIKLPLGISRQNYSCPVMNSSCEQVDTVGIACVNNTILMLTPGHDITDKGILISVIVNLEV
ncbi:TPA: hypothetical protein SHW33_002395 [Clostridioides difficile]|uniref:hypothetical protein n=2 Tax=Clostridioides difficile TaxID=1496 RepID=UPI00073E7DB6|nr:hypothetical protein [Clostridioides difficile]EGT3810324.1 hypothetical protein [Clostridioides difficile]EGT3866670.1 hypothetical protein [Clostridioides difficile]EGT4186926.1 hypothetical protein [Clostridioides difficile]EGT4546186.1 hypothetical protein [Clostridioides difficile]EGT4614422.1 hypothetical protein [Clostridioides difficile]